MQQNQNQQLGQAQLDQLGERIAAGIAAGLMRGVAAGVLKFAATMDGVALKAEEDLAEARRQAEADRLTAEAERIEKEKRSLRARIARAPKGGLKQLTLKKQLADLESAEERLCGEVIRQTPATVEAPALPAPVAKRVKGSIPSSNGTAH